MEAIKIRVAQLSFFYDADDADGCGLGYEDAGKLLVACRDYVTTGDAHITELFPAGHPGRMSWKAIRSQIDADRAQSETNAANRRGKKKRRGTTGNETERVGTEENEKERNTTNKNDSERNGTTDNDKQRKTTKNNETERTGTENNGPKEPLSVVNGQESTSARAATATATQDINNNKSREKKPDINSSSSEYTDKPRGTSWDGVRLAAIQAGVIPGKTTTASFMAACRKYAPDCTPEWAAAAVSRCVEQGQLTPRYMIGVLKGFQASGSVDTWPDGRRAGGRERKAAVKTPAADPFRQYAQRPAALEPESDVPQWLTDWRASHLEVA